MARILDVYTRVSHKADKRIISTQAQAQQCQARVIAVGAEVGKVWTDPGKSAWNPKVHRPDWEAMMARLEGGDSDGVVVYDLARFARRPADGERLIAAAERGLAVLDSGSEYDLTTASGKKNFRDNVNAAAYYSDMISESTRRGKDFKAQQGEVDQRRSFGFEGDGVTLLPDEVAILRDHAARLLAGETQQSLIAELISDGVPTVRGARWSYTTYRQLMRRKRNIGLIEHNEKVVPGVKLPGPQILDDDTYHRLLALYDARRPGRQPSGRYTLTGYADCVCGTPLSGRPVTGTPRKQYWCKNGCHRTFVDAARLDDWAGDFAVRTLSDPQHADAIAEADRELAVARQLLANEAAAIETDLIAVTDRLGSPGWNLARVDLATKHLGERLEAIQGQIAALTAEAAEALPAGVRTLPARDQEWVGWLDTWDSGTTADRRAMVSRALGGKRIVVGPGRAARFDSARVSVV